MHLQLGGSY